MLCPYDLGFRIKQFYKKAEHLINRLVGSALALSIVLSLSIVLDGFRLRFLLPIGLGFILKYMHPIVPLFSFFVKLMRHNLPPAFTSIYYTFAFLVYTFCIYV